MSHEQDLDISKLIRHNILSLRPNLLVMERLSQQIMILSHLEQTAVGVLAKI